MAFPPLSLTKLVDLDKLVFVLLCWQAFQFPNPLQPKLRTVRRLFNPCFRIPPQLPLILTLVAEFSMLLFSILQVTLLAAIVLGQTFAAPKK